MKTLFGFVCVCALALLSCATEEQARQVYPEDSVTLDAAINEAALYFLDRLPVDAKVAIVPFDAPYGRLSDYIFEELWSRFEDSGKFIMVDRRNLDRIESEINYQMGSGRVDDDRAVSITRQYGAEVLVYGQIAGVGGEYRLSIYATDVEKAASSQRAFTVRPDERLASLSNVSADDEIERAVSAMARAVSGKTTIAVGRISYAGTDTVSGFSAWLKNGIIAAAHKQREKFEVASESESADFAAATRGFTADAPLAGSAIQAVITGNYSPLDSGAEVQIQLVSSAGNRPVLSSSRLVIPASELERRRLSLLPEKDNAVIGKAEFESKQKALDPYAGKNNQWAFTVTPDDLDGIYYDGAFMSIRLYSERDCYFKLSHVDVNGNIQVIYPRAAADNNFIRAGETRIIPDNTRYKMGAPFGEELILASAYETPFEVNASSSAALLSEDSIARGLIVEGEDRAEISPLATAKFSYTILRGEGN